FVSGHTTLSLVGSSHALSVSAMPPFAAGTLQNQLSSLFADAITWGGEIWTDTPELALGLVIAVALPALAVVGLLLPTKRGASARTRGVSVVAAAAADAQGTPQADTPEVWLELRAGADGEAVRASPSRGAVLIGCDANCDLHLDGPGIVGVHAVALPTPDGGTELMRMANDEGVAIYIDGQLQMSAPLSSGQTVRIGPHLLDVTTSCHGLDQMPVQASANGARDEAAPVARGDQVWRDSMQKETADAEVLSSVR
ncbi:MAG: FHA domain-containing protein, partial [Pseudomonadota bacterium]